MRANDGALEYTLRVLRRRKFVILAALISVPLFAFLYSSAQPEEYTASATLLFESETESLDASREAATNEALAALPAVAAIAAKALDGDAGEVLGSVEVSAANENANVTTISATNESPQRAAEIANAYSDAYIDFRREADRAQFKESIAVLEARLQELPPAEEEGQKGDLLREELNQLEVEEALQTGKVSPVQEAGPPSSPSSPKTKRNVMLGIVFGLILGLGLAAVIERLDRHVRSVEELEELFGLPVIARIPRTKAFKNASVEQMLLAPEAEMFRTLRTNLRYLNINRDLSSLLIASPQPNDGKSTVAPRPRGGDGGDGRRRRAGRGGPAQGELISLRRLLHPRGPLGCSRRGSARQRADAGTGLAGGSRRGPDPGRAALRPDSAESLGAA